MRTRESIAALMYSVHVDNVLWGCEYPEVCIMEAITQSNRLLKRISYDFVGDVPLFVLYQSLVAYLACKQVRRQQHLDNHQLELQRVLRIDLWMESNGYRQDFALLKHHWDLCETLDLV